MENMTVRTIAEAVDGQILCGDADTPILHISIDSRKIPENALFVPLIGEKVDAHNFLRQAIQNGAAAVFTSRDEIPQDSQVPWIRVSDTLKALQKLGYVCRDQMTLPLVGVTGSVGKTTTREMIALALSAGFSVYKTPGNKNSQVGLPITLSEITSKDEIGVIELGMSEPGELSVITKIARPDMAVITNIGVTHIEQLGSRENIYQEKLSIQDGLKAGGTLLLNADDDMLMHTKARKGFRTLYYGTSKQADYRAEEIHLEEGYPVFTAIHGAERVSVHLHVMGEHNVLNAIAALAVSGEYHVPMKDAANALEQFCGFENRQQVSKKNDITIINDSYNASPASMKAAIRVLASMSAKRRIAVLADMKELGKDADAFHYEIGQFAAEQNIDFVVTCGPLAKQIAKGVLDAAKNIQVVSFMKNEDVIPFLDGLLKPNDCILLKGSNSMKLFEIAAHLLNDAR